MNRMVRITVLLALMTLALSVPCHACWWNDEDDWNNWADDYIFGYENDYGYPTDEAEKYCELDNVIKDGDYLNTKDWQDFIKDFDSWTEDKWYTEDTSDPPSNETEPTDPPGTNEGDAGGGNDAGNQDEVIGRGDRYWENPYKLYSLLSLISSTTIKTVNNLPMEFMVQEGTQDCSARGIATAMWLISGDAEDFELMLSYAYMAAMAGDSDIEKVGINDNKFMSTYGDVFNITEYEVGDYSHETVQSLIDNNTSVLAIIYTDEYFWQGVPYPVDTNIEMTHMVTIVAYNENSYFCSYGGKDAVEIPKSAIEEHSIYTCGQFDYEELKKRMNNDQ